MSKWKKSDFGKIIVFRDVKGLDNKVAIYSSNSFIPNTIGVVQYPIVPHSKSVMDVGVPKNQEKKGRDYLEKAGDWYFVKNVSKQEKSVLERIAQTPKVHLEEDLRDWSQFHTYPREEFSSYQRI